MHARTQACTHASCTHALIHLQEYSVLLTTFLLITARVYLFNDLLLVTRQAKEKLRVLWHAQLVRECVCVCFFVLARSYASVDKYTRLKSRIIMPHFKLTTCLLAKRIQNLLTMSMCVCACAACLRIKNVSLLTLTWCRIR